MSQIPSLLIHSYVESSFHTLLPVYFTQNAASQKIVLVYQNDEERTDSELALLFLYKN
jgi:hypothetical protein